ncbi:predicted protein [Naegleria gruberi]|uniref:Predicted protein n=1 Tax=Naegleria gruberi TaxID=5762 RepID=D2VBT7_NAEGR|nr:uncharacterized protein NAEGRDRAFT_79347 [Naegleria gruberi]EFC45645.1 predicted protein [Naegleria gruberi]|eukprot:XP_002678389.1 predicted protein [Naegleria gruberi strain NEG-M]
MISNNNNGVSDTNVLSINHVVHLIDSLEVYTEKLSPIVEDLLEQGESCRNRTNSFSQTHLYNNNTPCIGLDCEGSPDLVKQSGTLCIIQISLINKLHPEILDIYIIDVFKIGGQELSNKTNLRKLLESKTVLKVIHDGRRDSDVLFYQMNGTKLNFTFDTQIADVSIRQSHVFYSLYKSNNTVLSLFESNFLPKFVKWFCYIDLITGNSSPEHYGDMLKGFMTDLEDFVKETYNKQNYKQAPELQADCARSIANMIVNAAHSFKSHERKDAHIAAKFCRDVTNNVRNSVFFQKDGKDKFLKAFKDQIIEKTIEKFTSTLSKANFDEYQSRNHLNSQSAKHNSSILPTSSELISKTVATNMFERTGFLNIIFIVNLYHLRVIERKLFIEKILDVLISQEIESNLELTYYIVRLNYLVVFLSEKNIEDDDCINDNLENLRETIKSWMNTEQAVLSPSSPYLNAAKGEATVSTELFTNIDANVNIVSLDIVNINEKWQLKQLSQPSTIVTNNNTNNLGMFVTHYPITNYFKIKGLVRLLHDFCMIDYSSKKTIQEQVISEETYWKTRPLSSDQLEGAALDVKYLLFLYETQRLHLMNKKFKPGNESPSLASTIIRRSYLYDGTLRDYEFPYLTEERKEYLRENGVMDDGYFYVDIPLDEYYKSKSQNENKEQHLRLYFFVGKELAKNCEFEFMNNNNPNRVVTITQDETPQFTSKYFLGKLIGSKGKHIAELVMNFPSVSMGTSEQTFIVFGSYHEVGTINDLLIREKEVKITQEQYNKISHRSSHIKYRSGCEYIKFPIATTTTTPTDPTTVSILLGGGKRAIAKAEQVIQQFITNATITQ